MPQSEGMRVHDDSGGLCAGSSGAFGCRSGTAVRSRHGAGLAGSFLLQLFQVAVKSAPAVLHEDHLVLDPHDLTETEIREKFRGAAFGVDEKVRVSPGELHIDEMRHDLVHETLALVGMAHCKTAQRITEAAAGAHKFVIFVVKTAGIIEVFIPPDAFFLKKGVHLGDSIAVVFPDLGNRII